MNRTVHALLVYPNGSITYSAITDDLATMQQHVGGYIEPVGITADGFAYVNEEGLIRALPFNESATAIAHAAGRVGIRLFGTAVFLGNTPSGDDGDVPESVITIARALFPTTAFGRGWCVRCGHPYLLGGRPECECAGDPPVDHTGPDHDRYEQRVRDLHYQPGVTRLL